MAKRQPIPRKLRHQVFQRDGYRCRECGATNKQTRLHVDHIKPVAKGGTNDLNNLQTLCEACNRAKYTDEWVGGKINNKNNSFYNRNSIVFYGTKVNKDLYKYLNRIDDEFLPFLYKYVNDRRLSKTNKKKTINILIKNYSEKEIHSFISEARIQYSQYGDTIPRRNNSPHRLESYDSNTKNKYDNNNSDSIKFYSEKQFKEMIIDNIEELCRIYSIPKLGKTFVINRIMNEHTFNEVKYDLEKYKE